MQHEAMDISDIRIETERLRIRPFREADLEDFYRYASVPGVGEMAGWPHHDSIETSRQILLSFIEEREVLALEDRASGRVIGSLGVHSSWANTDPRFSHLKAYEIGYVLSRDYWGQGLMPEAVTAVIDYIFRNSDCDLLTCSHFQSNTQSRRVIEKAGFRFERHGSYHAKLINEIYPDSTYILHRSDWQKQKFTEKGQDHDQH